jgi:F0F1-type ATP synthase assembly protein I
LTILFFLLGVVAGVFNVIRATSPKAENFVRDSRLSGKGADAKDVPRVSPRGGDGQED